MIMNNIDVKAEEWRDIPGYEGLYQVSNFGRVYSVKRMNRDRCIGGRFICQSSVDKKNNSYMHVQLCKNGEEKCVLVHRLVAMAFIPNPDNLPQVNHKDENKQNNHVDNLEWCTHKYNMNYGSRFQVCMNHPRLSKPIGQFKDGVLVKTYPSIAEAIRATGKKNIQSVLYGKKKHCAGYEWKYL